MFQSKLPHVGTTIFSVMSQLASEHQAINLSQGFPDYMISPQLMAYVNEAMHDGYNQYAPMPGIPALRNILADKIYKLYQVNVNPETEITITPGATYAIYTAFTTFLQAGDEVIVLEPAYDSYIPNITLNGAKAVCVPLKYPDYAVDWQKVKDAITVHTKAIIINTPHNPTGYVWTADDMHMLDEITSNTNILIISDEVYEHITLDGRMHESVLKYENLRARSFVIYSFGKVFHATGWKIGYCVAPEALSKEFRKVHQFIGFTTNTPMQVALAKLLADEHEYLQLPHFFEQKRNLFLNLIKDLPFTIYQQAQGSYFQLAGYEKISKLGDKEFAIWLTQHIGVATIPISAFNHDGKDDQLIRFCFAKKDSTLIEAAERMKKLL
ncbi:MAG: aminotransferase class I/II-fold pyridoxal phosphate-dependent enzyme [Bacteroidetes bacterium]|nr:aminotransferase class I/II-fold pyridoxal phosphate-dependent enzyme [Bacteroidota bacterium]MBK8328278.1 aminotransferase class I/II-fold pyridoxal phosphate-dependent enzyme [Bacteroidota bacterium]MBK9300233.1 aminotransferase class I/II-fold pyridoxal phosphate-dependent enzyme [Bacteroidota bacterium]HQW47422.1 methionine aminotransferase [Chitinophagaceae bacterium]